MISLKADLDLPSSPSIMAKLDAIAPNVPASAYSAAPTASVAPAAPLPTFKAGRSRGPSIKRVPATPAAMKLKGRTGR